MGVSLALALPLTPLAFVEPFVGNLIVGLIVGQVATRLPFLYATGVAAGGWILGAFAVPLLHYWLDSFANPQRVDYTHGFEMYIGICVTFGLVVSPLAGLVAAKTA
jgi:Na+/citrate or Na+/malate symporter